MIGMLLVSHGEMAAGIKDSMELIMGETMQLDVSSLVAGQDFENFKKDVVEKIERLDSGLGVIVYVDLYGASPNNAAMMSFQELLKRSIKIRVITGMNLPMLLEVNGMRIGGESLENLAKLSLTSGREGIQDPISDLYSQNVEIEEEDGDY